MAINVKAKCKSPHRSTALDVRALLGAAAAGQRGVHLILIVVNGEGGLILSLQTSADHSSTSPLTA